MAIAKIENRVKEMIEDETPMYKIMILDYSMPEMDGPQVAIKVREILSNAGIRVPYICCCSAFEEIQFKQKALAVGMDHFLTKPIDFNELNKILELLNEEP